MRAFQVPAGAHWAPTAAAAELGPAVFLFCTFGSVAIKFLISSTRARD